MTEPYLATVSKKLIHEGDRINIHGKEFKLPPEPRPLQIVFIEGIPHIRLEEVIENA
tara:strand:- start:200 stop:370 length:171 start_codon:yes stop_codon:yes gene_type:complete